MSLILYYVIAFQTKIIQKFFITGSVLLLFDQIIISTIIITKNESINEKVKVNIKYFHLIIN